MYTWKCISLKSITKVDKKSTRKGHNLEIWIAQLFSLIKHLYTWYSGNNTSIVLFVPTIFLGATSENSWNHGDNKSAITLIPRQQVYTVTP
jgi:hypothetical protein